MNFIGQNIQITILDIKNYFIFNFSSNQPYYRINYCELCLEDITIC